jgi:N-acetylglutamate synthase-like GNAT family acetyltransferase
MIVRKLYISFLLPFVAMDIERRSIEDDHEYLVWDDNFSKVVATARLKGSVEGTEILMINVERMMRGSGIGTTLLKRIIEDFSCCNLYAWVFTDRTDWYERNGFEILVRDGDLIKVAAS